MVVDVLFGHEGFQSSGALIVQTLELGAQASGTETGVDAFVGG